MGIENGFRMSSGNESSEGQMALMCAMCRGNVANISAMLRNRALENRALEKCMTDHCRR